MSAAALLEMPPQQDGAPPRQTRLEALRAAAQRLDPARLHYLDVLSQRMTMAPAAVQRVLEGKLDAALTDLEERLHPPLPPAAGRAAGAQDAAAPLVALNQYIRGLKPSMEGALPVVGTDRRLVDDPSLNVNVNGDARPDLASVRRFREAWSRIAAEDLVTEAVERGPANAGPLNSHMLVLRTLSLLRGLSPDYLRRFVSQVETLQWLEQASQTLTPAKPKPARRSRVKK